MNKNVELKNEITFDEYKAWLMGMLRGKGNQLPNVEDWKAIKKMTEKVVPDVVEMQTPYAPVQVPYVPPTTPSIPGFPPYPYCSDDYTYTTSGDVTDMPLAVFGETTLAVTNTTCNAIGETTYTLTAAGIELDTSEK